MPLPLLGLTTASVLALMLLYVYSLHLYYDADRLLPSRYSYIVYVCHLSAIQPILSLENPSGRSCELTLAISFARSPLFPHATSLACLCLCGSPAQLFLALQLGSRPRKVACLHQSALTPMLHLHLLLARLSLANLPSPAAGSLTPLFVRQLPPPAKKLTPGHFGKISTSLSLEDRRSKSPHPNRHCCTREVQRRSKPLLSTMSKA